MRSVLILLVFGVSETFTGMPYPWHASCRLDWQVSMSCAEFKQKVINQISDWEGERNCGNTSDLCPVLPCGQRCLYQFISSTDDNISATHTTPAARYIDDISFTMVSNNPGCLVEALSTSQTWYAVLDYGTNYCNLRNIIDGARISDDNNFVEKTSDSQCTQYSMRDCSRY